LVSTKFECGFPESWGGGDDDLVADGFRRKTFFLRRVDAARGPVLPLSNDDQSP